MAVLPTMTVWIEETLQSCKRSPLMRGDTCCRTILVPTEGPPRTAMKSSRTASADTGEGDASFVLRPARSEDDPTLRVLLREAGLPFEDVESGRQDFFVALVHGDVVGCVGLERFASAGLLRSLAVREPHRGSGLGRALFEKIVEEAKEMGVQRLFLLTTTAAPFFARRGFVPADRSDASEGMAKSAQFASLCPSTAACMTMPL